MNKCKDRLLVTRFLSLTCLLFICCCTLLACQPTPTTPPVVSKEFDVFIESASENDNEGVDFQHLDIPPHIQAFIENAQKTVQVDIDATVVIPQAPSLQIRQVTKRDYTPDELRAVAENLVNGPLYTWVDINNGDEDYIVAHFTQEQIEDKLLEVITALQNGRTKPASPNVTEIFSVEGVDYTSWEEALNAQIELYTRALSNAKQQIHDQIIDKEEISQTSTLQTMACTEEYGYETLTIYNHYDVANRIFYARYPNGHETYVGNYSKKATSGTYYTELQMYAQEAEKIAEEMLKEIGLEGFSVYDTQKVFGGGMEKNIYLEYLNPRQTIYRLFYTRSINGIPVTYTNEQCNMSEDEVSAPWYYETIIFDIDDTGIIGFVWHSPYELTPDIVMENPKLLPFEEIINKFETMIFAKNGFLVGEAQSKRIRISEIRFGLMRITEKDNPGFGLLLPVWDFFGETTQYDGEGNEMPLEEAVMYENRSFLTINAITGANIDRGLGY